MVMFGVFGELFLVWMFVDILMGLMVIVNVIVLFMFLGVVIWFVKDYNL